MVVTIQILRKKTNSDDHREKKTPQRKSSKSIETNAFDVAWRDIGLVLVVLPNT